VLEVESELGFDVLTIAWTAQQGARGTEAPAVDSLIFDVGVLDQRADAVACTAALRRKDQVGVRELSGLVDAEPGLQLVRAAECDRLTVDSLDVGPGVGREADPGREPLGLRFGQ